MSHPLRCLALSIGLVGGLVSLLSAGPLTVRGSLASWGVVPLEGDPVYSALEVQVLGGESPASRVLVFRKDGRVDQYVRPKEAAAVRALVDDPWQPGPPTVRDFSSDSRWDGFHWSWDLDLVDTEDRLIHLALRERAAGPGARTVLGAIAPGSDPRKGFPLVVQHQVRFTDSSAASLVVSVEGQSRKPGRAWVAGTGDPWGQIRSGGPVTWSLWDPAAPPTPSQGLEPVLRFSPPLETVQTSVIGARGSGRFTLGVPDTWALVTGRWESVAGAAGVLVQILPEAAWQPFPGNPWVATWEWRGTWRQGRWSADSQWVRTNGWNPVRPARSLP